MEGDEFFMYRCDQEQHSDLVCEASTEPNFLGERKTISAELVQEEKEKTESTTQVEGLP